VRAAGILQQSGDLDLIEQVLNGSRGLLEAARSVERVAKLIGAYKSTSPAERASFGKAIGVADLFDQAVAPSL
jgi:hypothetical protein